MNEKKKKETFVADDPSDADCISRNRTLAEFLLGEGLDYCIEKIERLDTASLKGWKVIYTY